ncbi:unnamed protein product [Rotaria sp. Silwood2]|nr:unnamed protein product [Rotaria sp. Silwood2]
MENRHYSYLLWIISFAFHIYHILDSNKLTIYINHGFILITYLINIIAWLVIFILLVILLYIIINHCQLSNDTSSLETSKYQQLHNSMTNIGVKRCKRITDLPNFTPLTSYRCFHIDQTTSPLTVDEFIFEAKETTRFTIASCNNILANERFIQIEFVQELQSLVLSIEISNDYSPVLLDRINVLCAIIFDSSNIIQTWGNINNDLFEYIQYDFSFYDNLYKVHLLDIQQDFKQWYNHTFSHNQNCSQILDYNDIDGPLCSCSHRPYKCPDNQWSLMNAIAYTFAEYPNIVYNDANECLAATKLARVIYEQWTREQVKNYIKDQYIDHHVKINL